MWWISVIHGLVVCLDIIGRENRNSLSRCILCNYIHQSPIPRDVHIEYRFLLIHYSTWVFSLIAIQISKYSIPRLLYITRIETYLFGFPSPKTNCIQIQTITLSYRLLIDPNKHESIQKIQLITFFQCNRRDSKIFLICFFFSF